jgi:glycosyltransferase involved in cell wall biosynthesis
MYQGSEHIHANGLARTESLRLLFTAYPLLPVTDESCGGAEQVLATLESVLAERGHITTVAACNGSHAHGRVFPTGDSSEGVDQLAVREREHIHRILELLQSQDQTRPEFQLIHDHSGTFWQHTGALDLPVLATLHLPHEFYPPGTFRRVPPNVFFNCVSDSQRRNFADLPHEVGAVHNGIAIERFPLKKQKGDYLLWMGRLCQEKGAHIAIQVARASGMRLVIAGAVYPFSYHLDYFEREIRPQLGSLGSPVEYIGVPGAAEKYALLANARALLVSSLAEETSSLAAMEAMACGTPVVAFARGALPEVIADGVTGFLVQDTAAMVQALRRLDEIDPRACRSHVVTHHSASRMANDYEHTYAQVLTLFREQRAISEPSSSS